jgi:hypothetical protein
MLAQRLLSAPLSVIVSSAWQVAHVRLPALSQEEQGALLSELHRSASYLFAFPLIAAGIFSEFASKVFGAEWAGLSFVMPAIAGMALVSSVSNCTSYFAALHRYREESAANIILVIIRVSTVIFGARFFGEYLAVNLFAGSSMLVYLGINIFWGLKYKLVRSFLANFAISVCACLVILVPGKWIFGENPIVVFAWVIFGGLAYYCLCCFALLKGSIWRQWGK